MQGKERFTAHLPPQKYQVYFGRLKYVLQDNSPPAFKLKKIESEIYSVSKYGHFNLLFQFLRIHFLLLFWRLNEKIIAHFA